LSADARDAALRVAQEAVANALRHAKATRVDIYYEAVQGWMKLSVRDDGVGIRNVTPPARSGVGISGMRARAAALGGTLTVEAAADGRGTEVRLSTPADARAVMSGVAT
jgi:signal transduction histidine kinase